MKKGKIMKNRQYLLRFVEMSIGTILSAIGIYFMIKSNLGQTALVSLARNMGKILGIKDGTMMIIVNSSCLLINYIIMRKDFDKKQLLQIFLALLQGQIVNIFVYSLPIFKDLVPSNYLFQWIFMLLGILILSYGIAMMMKANIVKLSLEDLCRVISIKYDYEFSKVRQIADIVCIAGSLFIIFLFGLDFSTLREGTWACMLLLGPSMKYTFKIADRYSIS